MKQLNEQQIQLVFEWMENQALLRSTQIPSLFKIAFTDKLLKDRPQDRLKAPSIGERIDFANKLIENIDEGMPVTAILATTYWMQAEMLNLNRE